jgi:hypothetical protein
MAPLSGGHVPMPTSSMGFNKAAAWTNNHFGDSGLQSMNPSAVRIFEFASITSSRVAL